MDNSTFTAQIAAWHPFYSTVATACATLLGLLFLAMSLNLNLLQAADGGELRRQARQSFGNLMYALAVSLVFLVPFEQPLGMAFALVSLSAGGLLTTTREIVRARRDGQPLRMLVRGVGFSVFAHICLLFVAIRLLSADLNSLYILVAVIASMLVRPSTNAWNFLLQAQAAEPQSKHK